MTDNCLDIGTIQTYLDCELDHTRSAEVSGHIADCDACAALLAHAEDESAIVFPALEREFNTLVPTQRLWNKINDSITEQREGRTFWDKATAFMAAAFASQSLVTAAGLLIVVGFVALIVSNRNIAPVLISRSDIPSKVAEVSPAPVLPSTNTPGDAEIAVNEIKPRPSAKFET